VRVQVRLHATTADDTSKVEILDIKLVYDRVRLRRPIQDALYAHWDRMNSIQYFHHSAQLFGGYVIERATTKFSRQLFRQPRPALMFCILVKTSSINGVIHRTPFTFQSADLTHAVAHFDTKEYPTGGMDMQFPTPDSPTTYDIVDALNYLYDALGITYTSNAVPGISEPEFLSGSTVLAFSFGNQPVSPAYEIVETESASLQLDLTFGTSTPESLSLFCLVISQARWYLHQNGQVIVSSPY